MAPPVRFLSKRDGRRVAYTVHGQGEPLLCPAWWVSHLEEDWEDPTFQEFFGELAKHRTVVRYDRLGSGLSDRDREIADLETEVETLEELVEHLSIEEFEVFAVSCAGPPTLRFAVANPGRVKRLVLFNSYVCGGDVGNVEVKQAVQGLVRAHWGLGARTLTNLLAPDLSDDQVRKLCKQQRFAANAQMAAELLSLTFDVDVREEAAQLDIPTLVLHRKADQAIPFRAGRELAAVLPNAELVGLEGNEHIPWLGDARGAVRAILDFLGVHAGSDVTTRNSDPKWCKRGDVWELAYQGQSVLVKHARGLYDLAKLIENAGKEVHVGMLWSGDAAVVEGSAPMLDEEALRSYKARFHEIEAELEEAGLSPARAEALRSEREMLANELRSAVGRGGKVRPMNDASERARKAVSARIRSSIQKIEKAHPELGAHLRAHVKTGIHCSYEPSAAIPWTVQRY